MNSYSVNIDGIYYGSFNYGSWILVNNDSITIKDALSQKQTTVPPIINDESFCGWFINENIIVNCLIQDVANTAQQIDIFGKYNKIISQQINKIQCMK